MLNTAIKFEDYLEKSNQAKTKAELFDIYSKTVAQHGLDRVLLCLATDHKDVGESGGMAFMYNYPKGWMDYYFEQGLDKIDPVMVYSLTQIGSYRWDEIPKKMPLQKKQKDCLEMGIDAGLHNGICTPLRGPNHAIAGLSLASSEKADSFDGRIDLITAYSNHFYIAFRRLGHSECGEGAPVQNFALSEKEREILTWAARGKSYNDIAALMNISPHTVVFHMRSVFKKLGVNESVIAVVKALTYGLIHP